MIHTPLFTLWMKICHGKCSPWSKISTLLIVCEPPVVTVCDPSRDFCDPAILSSRSIHRHPFHLLNLKGSQITRGPPLSGGP